MKFFSAVIVSACIIYAALTVIVTRLFNPKFYKTIEVERRD